MRVQQNHFFACSQRVVEEMLVPITHQFFQTACIPVPIQTILGQQPAHMFEMLFQNSGSPLFVPFGKALGQIDLPDAAARGNQIIAQDTDHAADCPDDGKRQQLDQIQNGKQNLHFSFFRRPVE